MAKDSSEPDKPNVKEDIKDDATTSTHPSPSNRSLFEATWSGAQSHIPFIPRLRGDPPPYEPIPHSLVQFRVQEGRALRERRLQDLWNQLPKSIYHAVVEETKAKASVAEDVEHLTSEKAVRLKAMYEDELMGRCGGGASSSRQHIGWKEFEKYASDKEVELWRLFHDELDLDGNGHLDSNELAQALQHAGIHLTSTTLTDFMTFLTASPHSHAITFAEFRDFLLLLPRKVDTKEIYRYYEVQKFMGDDGKGAARVTMEGDVSLSAEDAAMPTLRPASQDPLADHFQKHQQEGDEVDYYDEDYPDEEEEHHKLLGGSTAGKFLLAGGIAGAVSRTATAPFDRLKIFLITRPPDLGGTSLTMKPTAGLKTIGRAVGRIYAEGGALAFWTGNGLSVLKIFPESAIKFFAYESSKRAFARYWDKVEDSRDISGFSRFCSGGIGGITSQLSIYPIETLKTQMMSNTGQQRHTLVSAMKRVWALGGARAYYRGLTIGLVGVFPYSAIDMSTFEALKLAYLRSTGKTEPGVLAVLAFGSISGSVGATSVYPLNLVRTRLQASGSSGHPERYTGVWDVCAKTYRSDGWRGFYRGLLPTLAKVVPAVSISYVVYEHTKTKLGV